ncbi:MAG: hypothetical protein SEPTF4163_000537 [Sporothrix epigloea]
MADDHEINLTKEEANRILHLYRKKRYGTACWPCRQRKVKCDTKKPCETCIKRGHAQLCLFKPEQPSAEGTQQQNTTAGPSSVLSVQADEKISTTKLSNNVNKRARSLSSSEGRRTKSLEPVGDAIQVDSNPSEMSRYLGQNSIPAFLREQATSSRQEGGVEHIRQDMQSIFEFDSASPYPLMSSRHLDRLTVDISAELPSDREVMKLFHAYKEIPHPFWGFVLDVDDLESRLIVYLEERANNAKKAAKVTRPVSPSWLAILFAVMAVGSQYHDSPYPIRARDSQRFIQISFHFLRVGNFLLRPDLDSLQAMLLTGFVLLNDMKAEASWALLGLTTRLAQSLGLDRASRESSDSGGKDHLRRTLWWTIVWHDCLTSLSFDRTPMTAYSACPIPRGPNAIEGLRYLEGMYHLCQIVGRRLAPEQAANITYEQILENCKMIEDIRDKMVPQLRSKEACRSAIDRLHYFAIRLHTAFVVSVCCRPALRSGEGGALNAQHKAVLAERCKLNLTETVRMFLAMHQLSVIPTRSWAFMYHGLSSALLLGILGVTKTSLEVRGLQGDLIDALSATAAKEKTSPKSQSHRADRDIELSGPLSRALTVLKNIYDHCQGGGQNAAAAAAIANSSPSARRKDDNNNGNNRAAGNSASHGSDGLLLGQSLTVSGSVSTGTSDISGATSGVVTPQLPQDHDSQSLNTLLPLNSNFARNLDPRQNAALAMAELQHGSFEMGRKLPWLARVWTRQ